MGHVIGEKMCFNMRKTGARARAAGLQAGNRAPQKRGACRASQEERIMRRTLRSKFLAACSRPMIALLLAVLMAPRLPVPAAAEAQKDANACLRTSNALYKRGEELHKKRRWQIPREFGRVAANLDDYCRDKQFKRADIAIEWLNACLRNYDKQGSCTLDKKYFCAIDADSEACRTAS
jgi:hypothetical protein